MKSDNEVLECNVRMISDIDTSLGNIKQAMSEREREREKKKQSEIARDEQIDYSWVVWNILIFP